MRRDAAPYVMLFARTVASLVVMTWIWVARPAVVPGEDSIKPHDAVVVRLLNARGAKGGIEAALACGSHARATHRSALQCQMSTSMAPETAEQLLTLTTWISRVQRNAGLIL